MGTQIINDFIILYFGCLATAEEVLIKSPGTRYYQLIKNLKLKPAQGIDPASRVLSPRICQSICKMHQNKHMKSWLQPTGNRTRRISYQHLCVRHRGDNRDLAGALMLLICVYHV